MWRYKVKITLTLKMINGQKRFLYILQMKLTYYGGLMAGNCWNLHSIRNTKYPWLAWHINNKYLTFLKSSKSLIHVFLLQSQYNKQLNFPNQCFYNYSSIAFPVSPIKTATTRQGNVKYYRYCGAQKHAFARMFTGFAEFEITMVTPVTTAHSKTGFMISYLPMKGKTYNLFINFHTIRGEFYLTYKFKFIFISFVHYNST